MSFFCKWEKTWKKKKKNYPNSVGYNFIWYCWLRFFTYSSWGQNGYQHLKSFQKGGTQLNLAVWVRMMKADIITKSHECPNKVLVVTNTYALLTIKKRKMFRPHSFINNTRSWYLFTMIYLLLASYKMPHMIKYSRETQLPRTNNV